jgi:hypothetical protein
MSTILKALRRLEDKKADAAQRPLRDEVVVGPGRRRVRSAFGPAIAAGFALAFAGVALLWALDPASESDRGIGASSPPAVSAAPDPVPPDDPYAETASSGAAFEDGGAPEFEIVRPDPTAAQRPLAPPPLPRLEEERAAPLRTRSATAVDPEHQARYETLEPELPVYEEEPFYDEPEREVVVAKPSASVRVARTQWHPNPDRRLAWVEVAGSVAMREVREGERVGPYVVREIEPAAVLFADGAVEVRREVGR